MGIDLPISIVFIETRTSHATPHHTTSSSDFQFPISSAAFRLEARGAQLIRVSSPYRCYYKLSPVGHRPPAPGLPAASRERSSWNNGSRSWSASLPHRYGERSSTVTVTVTVSISFLSAAAAYAVVVSAARSIQVPRPEPFYDQIALELFSR